jgi:hypothetical protein
MGRRKIKMRDGSVLVDTGLPQRSIKPLYLEMHMEQLKTYFHTLTDPANFANGVIKMMGLFFTNTILDTGTRERTIGEIEAEIKKRIGDDNDLDFPARMRIESEITMEISVRNMTDYLDQAFGVSHRLAIGITGDAPDDDMLDYTPPAEVTTEYEDGRWVDVDND